VLRLGSAILTAVLLGVPRALDARAFGAARSVYVEVEEPSPELAGFAAALSRALAEAGCRVAPRPTGATVVVEIHALWKGVDSRPDGRDDYSEAIGFTVRDARGRRPLVLHYPAGRQAEAARALLRALDEPGPRPLAAGWTQSA
jgi:hypothetical protein